MQRKERDSGLSLLFFHSLTLPLSFSLSIPLSLSYSLTLWRLVQIVGSSHELVRSSRSLRGLLVCGNSVSLFPRRSDSFACVFSSRERERECVRRMYPGVKRFELINSLILLSLLLLSSFVDDSAGIWKRREDKTKCPKVKGIRNFDISEFLGSWYIVQYYASSEETLTYRCMRAELSVSSESAEVTMNFTYSFTDDPINEQLVGNITWKIPSPELPAHWVHAEFPYEEIYNTYILDSDYKTWALLMHCAEKNKSPRYLSSFIMSREPSLGINVISYLREKLPKYDIDLEYMFPMEQKQCNQTDVPPYNISFVPISTDKKSNYNRRHLLKRKHRKL